MSDYWSDEYARSVYCGGDEDGCKADYICKWHLERCEFLYPHGLDCGIRRIHHANVGHVFLPARPTASDAVQSSAAAAKPEPGQVGQAGDVALLERLRRDERFEAIDRTLWAGDEVAALALVSQLRDFFQHGECRLLHDETGDPRKCSYCATHHVYVEPRHEKAVSSYLDAPIADVEVTAKAENYSDDPWVNAKETKRDLLARLEAADEEIRRGYTVTDVDQGIELGFKTAIDTVRRYFE